ncbi:putative nicotianamine synthase, S-adenosyl-L-methionine-dependent methyltransferase [Helianthus debilis subsp. tardiflorus]
MASHLVASDDDLSERMVFHTADIMDVTNELQNYDAIFLAALVGIDVDEKVKVIQHLAKYMAPGASLGAPMVLELFSTTLWTLKFLKGWMLSLKVCVFYVCFTFKNKDPLYRVNYMTDI